MDVKIQYIHQHNPDILAFELVHPNGEALPSFQAGAHIDVHLADGLIRQYSLANCSSEQQRYVIGVLKDANSRGGSRFIHEKLNVGQTLSISEPRNLFALDSHLKRAVLCAGGIGITPILAMAKELKRQNKPFTLLYFVKNRQALAFEQDLQALGESVHLHIDDEVSTHGQLEEILKQPVQGQHLYVCGPDGFMTYVMNTAKQYHWADDSLHQEHFSAPAIDTSNDGSFSIKILKTGQLIHVSAEQTAVKALEDAGICVPVSCEQGICGTCLVEVVEGEVEHRDLYLTEEEQAENRQFTPCCSRAKSKILVVDI